MQIHHGKIEETVFNPSAGHEMFTNKRKNSQNTQNTSWDLCNYPKLKVGCLKETFLRP